VAPFQPVEQRSVGVGRESARVGRVAPPTWWACRSCAGVEALMGKLSDRASPTASDRQASFVLKATGSAFRLRSYCRNLVFVGVGPGLAGPQADRVTATPRPPDRVQRTLRISCEARAPRGRFGMVQAQPRRRPYAPTWLHLQPRFVCCIRLFARPLLLPQRRQRQPSQRRPDRTPD
jgi:hypothetical protein